MPVGTKIRSVRVPDETWVRAQERAKRDGETVSDVVLRALREYAGQAEAPTPAPATKTKRTLAPSG